MSNTNIHTKMTKEDAERIATQLSAAGAIRTRNMMGGYLVYLDDVLVGQINSNKLHIKITESGEAFSKHFTKVSPYPGARLAFEVADKDLTAEWLSDFLLKTRADLTVRSS